jgi:hypothetical protein
MADPISMVASVAGAFAFSQRAFTSLSAAFGGSDSDDVLEILDDLQSVQSMIRPLQSLMSMDERRFPLSVTSQIQETIMSLQSVFAELETKVKQPKSRIDRILAKGRWKSDKDRLHKELLAHRSKLQMLLQMALLCPDESSPVENHSFQ